MHVSRGIFQQTFEWTDSQGQKNPEFVNRLSLRGKFNFLYIPLDKGTMANVGYAFVNFIDKDGGFVTSSNFFHW